MKNLNEVSELIDNTIIQEYVQKNKDLEYYQRIGHPDIIDDIRPIEI